MRWTKADTDRTALGLYNQVQLQRATFRNFEQVLAFVRIRQSAAPHTIDAVAQKLWEIARENLTRST